MSMLLNGMLRSYSYCVRFIIASLMLSGVVTAFSPAAFADEADVVQKLVGKWEGNASMRNGFRTLIIESVKKDGDQ